MTIETGEPVDIDYRDGSVWLAYPDGLLRSNPAALLEDITSWETVPIPEGMRITAIKPFRENFVVVLDGEASKIYLLHTDGSIGLTWDVPGSDHETGDIIVNWENAYISMMDGQGKYYTLMNEFVGQR